MKSSGSADLRLLSPADCKQEDAQQQKKSGCRNRPGRARGRASAVVVAAAVAVLLTRGALALDAGFALSAFAVCCADSYLACAGPVDALAVRAIVVGFTGHRHCLTVVIVTGLAVAAVLVRRALKWHTRTAVALVTLGAILVALAGRVGYAGSFQAGEAGLTVVVAFARGSCRLTGTILSADLALFAILVRLAFALLHRNAHIHLAGLALVAVLVRCAHSDLACANPIDALAVRAIVIGLAEYRGHFAIAVVAHFALVAVVVALAVQLHAGVGVADGPLGTVVVAFARDVCYAETLQAGEAGFAVVVALARHARRHANALLAGLAFVAVVIALAVGRIIHAHSIHADLIFVALLVDLALHLDDRAESLDAGPAGEAVIVGLTYDELGHALPPLAHETNRAVLVDLAQFHAHPFRAYLAVAAVLRSLAHHVRGHAGALRTDHLLSAVLIGFARELAEAVITYRSLLALLVRYARTKTVAGQAELVCTGEAILVGSAFVTQRPGRKQEQYSHNSKCCFSHF